MIDPTEMLEQLMQKPPVRQTTATRWHWRARRAWRRTAPIRDVIISPTAMTVLFAANFVVWGTVATRNILQQEVSPWWLILTWMLVAFALAFLSKRVRTVVGKSAPYNYTYTALKPFGPAVGLTAIIAGLMALGQYYAAWWPEWIQWWIPLGALLLAAVWELTRSLRRAVQWRKIGSQSARTGTTAIQHFRYYRPIPVRPESMAWRVYHSMKIIAWLYAAFFALDKTQHDTTMWWWAWWPVTVIVVVVLAWHIYDRWHVYFHIETLLPYRGTLRYVLQAGNAILAAALAGTFLYIGWNTNRQWFLAAILAAWCLGNWVWGARPNPIHGELVTSDFEDFHLPIARRVAFFYVVGLILTLLLELLVAGFIIYIAPWPLKWLTLFLWAGGSTATFVWWTNHFTMVSQAWRTVRIQIKPRIIESDDTLAGDLTGGITATGQDRVGSIRVVNVKGTVREIWYRVIHVVWVDLGTVIEDLKDVPIPLVAHNAWQYEGGPKAPNSIVRKGKRAVQVFFRVSGDEGKDEARWSGDKKTHKAKTALRDGKDSRRPF